MDNQSLQQQDQITSSKLTNSSPRKTIVIFICAILFAFVIGFISRPFIISTKTVSLTPQKSVIDESKLPISLALLTNPIVYQWTGSVRGKLIEKNEHNFTLADDQNHNIIITEIMPSGDKWNVLFFDKTNKMKEASYSAIPIGSTLLGDFFIFKGGSNTPVGGTFVKQ